MRRKKLAVLLVAAASVFAFPFTASARIKLITLPVRERVEIQLDHSSATLVEEERIIPLIKGENQVDFSWANTQIDPQTILFRILPGQANAGAEAKVVSVSYPPGEASLVWSVGAGNSGTVRVRISYLLGNLSKSFSYRAVASKNEATLSLSQYIRLQNLANEEYASTDLWAGFGKEFRKPIGINETKEMLMSRIDNIPIRKTYTCDPSQYGYLDEPQKKLRVPMHYVIKNDKAAGLGISPLQRGKVRIFIGGDAKESSTAFLGEDWGAFTPVDDEMKLYLGTAQDIAVRRTIERNEAIRVAGNLYNQDVVIKYEIENFKDIPVKLDLIENPVLVRREARGERGRDVEWTLGPQTTFEGGLDRTDSTYDKLIFHAALPARSKDGKAEKITHKLHLIIKNEW